MLWIGPAYSNLVLTTRLNPLKYIEQLEERQNIEILDAVDVKPLLKHPVNNTVVFLENKVGFQELEDIQTKKMKELISGGSLVAFTCHSSCRENPSLALTSLFGDKFDCKRFDPREIYGDSISDQCRLHLHTKNPNMNDIYYFTSKVENTSKEHLLCV